MGNRGREREERERKKKRESSLHSTYHHQQLSYKEGMQRYKEERGGDRNNPWGGWTEQP